MSVKKLSKGEKFGIIKQANWATPAAATAAYHLCQWVNAGSINPNPDVQVDQFNVTSQNGIHYEAERFFVDYTSGLPTIPFSGTCEKATMAPFLVGAFQAVTEADTTPYEKTITCGGLTGPIDFAANAGFLHTIAIRQGASADDGVILENAIIQNLNIAWDLNARGVARLVNMSGAWVGNELNYEQDATTADAWANETIAQTGFFNNTDTWGTTFSSALLTIGGVIYATECVRKVELQVNNNVTSNCKTTGGKANQYDLSPEYKMIVTLDYNSATEKILKDFQVGELSNTMFWSNDPTDAGGDGKWSITSTNMVLVSPPKIYNGDFLGIQLDLRCVSYGAATPLTMYYTDTVHWTYGD